MPSYLPGVVKSLQITMPLLRHANKFSLWSWPMAKCCNGRSRGQLNFSSFSMTAQLVIDAWWIVAWVAVAMWIGTLCFTVTRLHQGMWSNLVIADVPTAFISHSESSEDTLEMNLHGYRFAFCEIQSSISCQEACHMFWSSWSGHSLLVMLIFTKASF